MRSPTWAAQLRLKRVGLQRNFEQLTTHASKIAGPRDRPQAAPDKETSATSR